MKFPVRLLRFAIGVLAMATTLPGKTPAGASVALLLAGPPSHGPGAHEYNAGVLLLQKCLAQAVPALTVKVHRSGDWPSAEEFARADTVLVYSDGGEHHLLLADHHLRDLAKAIKHGAGLVLLHYAVEFPTDRGGTEALQWAGGFFETNWSVNPMWKADYRHLPEHPVTRGVRPFQMYDEWYYHMRFNARTGRIIPILIDLPPASSLDRPDGEHSGNPTVRADVRAGKIQTMAWAYERPDGGRGFAFTGGHYHHNWGNADQRKLVLNAILWTAHLEIPEQGVASQVSAADLAANLDPKPTPAPSAH